MSVTGETDVGTLAEKAGDSERICRKSSSIPFSIGADASAAGGAATGAEKSRRATRRTGCPGSAIAGLGAMKADADSAESAAMMRMCDTPISCVL